MTKTLDIDKELILSIDDATPEEWDEINAKRNETNVESNGASALGKSYSNIINVAMVDNINNPEHYNQGSVECIEAIEAMLTPDEFIGYLRGNSLKYRWRMRYKGSPIDDQRKAAWYENKLLDYWTENENELGQEG